MQAFVELLGAALKGIGWVFLPLLLLPLLYLFFPRSSHLTTFSKLIITIVDGFSFRLGEIIKWTLPLLVLSTAFGVFALSIFGVAWTKLFESAVYFHTSVIMLGSAATLLAGKHVRVDVFHSVMPQKTRAWVDFIGFYILLMPVCLIIIWNSQSFTYFAWRIFEGSNEADGINAVFLLKTLIPLFALTVLVQGMAISLRAAMCLNGVMRPARPTGIDQLFMPDTKPELNAEAKT